MSGNGEAMADPVQEARPALVFLLRCIRSTQDEWTDADERDWCEVVDATLEEHAAAIRREEVARALPVLRFGDEYIDCECVLYPPPHDSLICAPHEVIRAEIARLEALVGTGSMRGEESG